MSVSPLLAAMGPAFFADPYAVYRMMNASDPVLWVPAMFNVGAWLVTDYAACAAGLRNKLFIKEAATVVPPERLALLPVEGSSELVERRKNNMLFRDPPAHTRLRALVSQAFTPRMVEQLRPRIEALMNELVAALPDDGTVDLLKAVAFPLPVIVIAEMLGVPPEDRDRFKAWSSRLTLGLNPGATQEELAGSAAAARELDAYLEQVIQERRRAPRADLISDLVKVQAEDDRLTDAELNATCRLLLTAGHETTVNLIGNGVLALLRNPEAYAELAADPSKAAHAVDELLRYDSPVQMTIRFASEDTRLGGHDIKRGDAVLFLMGGANRDAKHFADPDRLDLARANANSHLSFGGGVHYCLGAPLAKLEGALALAAIVRRAPHLKLAVPAEDLTWRKNMVLRGLDALPVHARKGSGKPPSESPLES